MRDFHASKTPFRYLCPASKTFTKPAWYRVCTANPNFFFQLTFASFCPTFLPVFFHFHSAARTRFNLRMPALVRSAAAKFLTPVLLAALSLASFAEDPLPQIERLQTSPVLRHLKKNDLGHAPSNPAEHTLAQMYLPPGFKAEAVVSEPDIHQPIAMTFDERGRIWVAEAYSYPVRQPEGKGLDKIVIFEDTDGDGKFETRKVFAEGLNLVSGFEVGFGGVWVGAAPYLLFIADKNRDDKPDGEPQILLDGFGYQDTHECLNSFMWGPDGWLYGNQGVFNYGQIGKPGTPPLGKQNEDTDSFEQRDAPSSPSPLGGERVGVRGDSGAKGKRRVELRAGVWRYHPVRHEFEVFAEGGSNQWGLDYDEHGQIFMTHCRSYWGRGGTTHVIQGGVFWNQANANYPDFIVAEPPRDFPSFRNYLLASARYDHGAGGAGEPGSDAIYGGHSHVGTMIYYGDNWPAEYRGRLFTHNLHGHQINQQVNLRERSGFNTVHAGRDMSFCADPKYVAVDLQYGPDGSVYIIDWYDQQHCHNPNTERWDRSNGRIYRIQYADTYKPVKVDLAAMSNDQLLDQQTHSNQWYARTARRLIQERAAESKLGPDSTNFIHALRTKLLRNNSAKTRLAGYWIAHAIGLVDEVHVALLDPDEFVRGWGVQLRFAFRNPEATTLADKLGSIPTLQDVANFDSSPLVRLYLASAVQRSPNNELAWELIEALAQQGEDRDDRNIPYLIWQGLATLMKKDPERAFRLAERTLLPQLADWIYWYGSTLSDSARDKVVERISKSEPKDQQRLLAGLELALKTRANLQKPQAWDALAAQLYKSDNTPVVHRAELVAAAFGDQSRFPNLRTTLAKSDAANDAREHAFTVLSRAQDSGSLDTFIALLDDNRFRARIIPLLARFESPKASEALLSRLNNFNTDEKNAALNTLTSRASFAKDLLAAIESGRIKRDAVNAFHIRQFTQLNNAEITVAVSKTWGRIGTTEGEKKTQITALEKVFTEAPLWAFDTSAGRKHFQTICASCHKLGEDGTRLGPDLTGSGKNGINYYLENVIDPNAVIGTDFQMTVVETKDGDLISGLLVNESPDAITIRTTATEEKISKSKIAKRHLSDKSLMPEGLLDTLGDREKIELLKYLTTH
jgi:putative membrane-bound dehydrogenase-like protein